MSEIPEVDLGAGRNLPNTRISDEETSGNLLGRGIGRLYIMQTSNPLRYYIFWLAVLVILLVAQLPFVEARVYRTDYVFWMDFLFFAYTLYIIPRLISRFVHVLNKTDTELDSLGLLAKVGLNPWIQLGIGMAVGLFVCGTILAFDVVWRYPYFIFHFVFGFMIGAVGFLMLFGALALARIARSYTPRIEIMNPDEMGGLSWFADAITHILMLVMLFEALILIIVSSGHFLESRNYSVFVLIASLALVSVSVGFLLYLLVPVSKGLVRAKEDTLAKISGLSHKRHQNLLTALAEKDEKMLDAVISEHMAVQQLYDHVNKVHIWPMKTRTFIILALSAGNLILAPIMFAVFDRLLS